MLQRMREKTQGIIASVIIVLICLTFALWGIQYYLQDKGDVGVIAKVGKVNIRQNQFNIAYDRAKQGLMMRFGSNFVIDQNMQGKLKASVLQELINNIALRQTLNKLGMRASQAQINALLTSLPAFQSGGHFSLEKFQQVLNMMLYSEQEFVQEMQQNIVISQLHNGITWSSFALPNETTNFWSVLNQGRDIGYAVIPAMSFKLSVKISEQDIQDYYKQHGEDFQIPEQVSIAYVELAANDLASKIQSTPQALQQYYNEHIDLYSSPKKWQTAEISLQLQDHSGKALKEATAKILTMAKDNANFSKPTWLIDDQLPPEIKQKLQNLKAGQLSEPLQVDNKLVLIKLLQIQEASTTSFAKVHDQVLKAYQKDKLEQLFNQTSNRLSDLAYTNSDSLDPIAKELNLPVKTTPLFTAGDATKIGILSYPGVIKTAFSDVVLKQNYNSDLIEVAPGRVVVLRIKEHKQQAIKPLSEVRSIIAQRLIEQKSQEKAQALGEQLLASMQQGKDAKQLLSQQNIVWQTAAKVERKTIKLNPQIVMAAFSLSNIPEAGPKVTGIVLDSGDYALVQLYKAYNGDVKQLDVSKVKLLQQDMGAALGEIEYELFVQSVLKNTKVKKYIDPAA